MPSAASKAYSRCARLSLGAVGAIIALIGHAFAGAWTEPAGQGQIIETLSGWMGDGAPYGGQRATRESRVEAQTYADYGLYDRLTLFGEISPERYTLSAPGADRFIGLDYSGAGVRAKIWSNDAWVFSLEASAYVSSARDAGKSAQAGNTGGEGELRGLAGHNLEFWGAPAFVDAEFSYRLRTAGPPDEFHGDVTLGIKWPARWMGLVQVFNTVSNGAGAPGYLAWQSHTTQLSIVYAFNDYWSVQVGGFATFVTVNTNTERGVLVAMWRRF